MPPPAHQRPLRDQAKMEEAIAKKKKRAADKAAKRADQAGRLAAAALQLSPAALQDAHEPVGGGPDEGNLWLPSPAAMEPAASFGIGEGAAMSGRVEQKGKTVGGKLHAEVAETKPQPSTGGEIKRLFLKNLKEGLGELTDFVPAMHLAMCCSLSRASTCLQRGPVLSGGERSTVTVVRHELGRFVLKEATPVSWSVVVGSCVCSCCCCCCRWCWHNTTMPCSQVDAYADSSQLAPCLFALLAWLTQAAGPSGRKDAEHEMRTLVR